MEAGAVWRERIGSIVDTVAELGRVSDLVIIGKPDPGQAVTEEIFKTALYATGRPALIAPDRLTGDLLDHVLIAWNGSVEAARAVAGAMPFLKAARRVSIFSVPEHTKARHMHLGLIEHLAHHGIHAQRVAASAGPNDLGQRLAKTAREVKATMIVMGAYTHPRVQEVLLGGVTRYMVRNTEIPVLMAH